MRVHPLVSWWRLVVLFLIAGIVLSPLSASAATVPVLEFSIAAITHTATILTGRLHAAPGEVGTACVRVSGYHYADAPYDYDDTSNPPAGDRLRVTIRAVEEYDCSAEISTGGSTAPTASVNFGLFAARPASCSRNSAVRSVGSSINIGKYSATSSTSAISALLPSYARLLARTARSNAKHPRTAHVMHE